jgi:diguanylate cyclase (GGDEF)-like protein
MTAALDRSFDWAARFVAEVPAAVALFDRDLRYAAASPAWIAAFGLGRAKFLGRRHGELCQAGRAALEEVQRRGLAGEPVKDYPIADDEPASGPASGPAPGSLLGARPHYDPDSVIAGVIVGLREDHAPGVMEAVQPAPDRLTGLAERHEFTRRLRAVLSAPEEADPDLEHQGVVVLAVNLDSFRNLNNLHGFGVGDQVLKIIGERLVSGIRSRHLDAEDEAARGSDVVARLGADEFGIICGLPALAPAEAEAFATRLLRMVQNPIAIGARSFRLTASIGLITTTPDHQEADDALRDLDLALQQAKALGPGKVSAWEPGLTRAATRRYSLAEQLRQAFDNAELALHYQPILRLSDNLMVGAEALLRWNHPSEGLVSSVDFLPVLEETGLIVEIGAWVIREAVRQVESWRLLYGRDIVDWISVNLSARQFNDPAPLLTSLRGIYDSGFSVHRLKFEITETAFMRNPEITRAVLAQFDAMGIRVAIDDFGTGYSSLNSLRLYPVDTIKIDAEFVGQIGTAEGDKLFQGLLNICRVYGAQVIAEGVESTAQRDFLRASGCDFGQGYLFADAMDGALFGAYALTHAVQTSAGSPRPPMGTRPSGTTINPRTSRGPLRAG